MFFLITVGCDRPAGVEEILGSTQNVGVTAEVGCDELFSCKTLVFDVDSVDGSKADVTRVLFQVAGTQKNNDSYDKVILAYHEKPRFFLLGSYFRELGAEYDNGQNPIYLMNHLPENVKNLDGSPAFETWTGGWLGVATKQIADLNTLHDRWWSVDQMGEI